MLKTPKLRYYVKIELKSGIIYKLAGEEKTNEYYFETGRRGDKQRTPTKGYFSFDKVGALDIKFPIALYTELITVETERELEVPLYFKEKNTNLFKMDETTTFFKFSINLGDNPQSKIIKENNIELRLVVSTLISKF